MPPLPTMRISTGKELKAENHKRGRSLERGILCREKDSDLALFNEVQNKERENFLLQSNIDFDDIFSTKLGYFSEYKLGISVPAQGESSDLLNTGGDKNDYDWLISPPETPLFPSLDDETPSISLAPRGRPRSQPFSISPSSMMDQRYRSGRGSASPHRLSPSSQFGKNSTSQSTSMPFSATHSSPPPTLRHPTSSRKPSPPPSKSFTPAPRSCSPTPRRMSTGSTGASTPSRVRGTSPINTSRGNSASPKTRSWHSNIPGFSLEAPPNLRTSLADGPASYVRGSSPASRNGSRSSRQSMSPTASRSVSSSHSHDRGPFSSHIKDSVASSGYDDIDSLQSISISSSDHSAPRSTGAFPNNRAMGFSKNPTKIMSSSAPKRSFDLALRQMDRKGPQNMFRPLLSSVPTSTFYVGKTSAHHPSMVSRNSSITNSSNASSDLGTSGAHDTDGSEQNQEDVTSNCVKGQHPDVHDEIFFMDQVEDVENRIVGKSPGSRHDEIDDHSIVNSQSGVPASISQLDSATSIDSDFLVLNMERDCSDADGTKHMASCSKCGCVFHSADLGKEGYPQICLECKSLEVNSTIIIPLTTVMVGENTGEDFVQILEHGSLEALNQYVSIPESLQVTCCGEAGADHLDKISKKGQCSNSEPRHYLAIALMKEDELTVTTQQVLDQSVLGDTSHPQFQQMGFNFNSKVDVSEGAGISLLLKRSSSENGHVVQSRIFTATHTSYDDFSYVGDSANSMRSSIGHSTASVSSSVDLGSSRQIETRIHRQSSGQKLDIENYRSEMPMRHKRSVSSLSGASGHVFQVLSVTPSSHVETIEVIAANMEKEVVEATNVDPREQSLASECNEATSTCTDFEINDIYNTSEELSSHLMIVHLVESSLVSVLSPEAPASHDNGDQSANNFNNSMNVETSSMLSHTLGVDAAPNSSAGKVDVAEVSNPSSLDAISESESEDADIVSVASLSDVDSTNLKSCCTNELMEPSGLVAHNGGITSAEELGISDPALGAHEESIVMLDDLGSMKARRSLTVEDATDSILFCTSIVHNLAYEAANIAIEKEHSQVEVLRPTVTFVDISNSDRMDIRSRNMGKRSSKSQKSRQKRLETETKPISCNAESVTKSSQCIIGAPPDRGDSMKPPKLESKCNCTIM